MKTDSFATDETNDPSTTWVLLAIWLIGLIVTRTMRNDIPISMLVIGTVFFIILIPAMRELTRKFEGVFFPQARPLAKKSRQQSEEL